MLLPAQHTYQKLLDASWLWAPAGARLLLVCEPTSKRPIKFIRASMPRRQEQCFIPIHEVGQLQIVDWRFPSRLLNPAQHTKTKKFSMSGTAISTHKRPTGPPH